MHIVGNRKPTNDKLPPNNAFESDRESSWAASRHGTAICDRPFNRSLGSTAMRRDKWIPVLPKNYRRIALYAIGIAAEPIVLANRKPVTDFSETGPLTQKRMRELIDFEIRDGSKPILGFHDNPNEMWITEGYAGVASHCAMQGWLKVEGRAS